MYRAWGRAADDPEGRTFFLDGLCLPVFCAYRRRRAVQGVQCLAAVLGFGPLEGDGESGFYHVKAVTQTSQVFHEHPHAVNAYLPLLNGC
jgi:hypothetical protein